ncbi:MAG: hypothetical protein DFNUSKGM_000352 [Candidatus Fervidibacter sacchari]
MRQRQEMQSMEAYVGIVIGLFGLGLSIIVMIYSIVYDFLNMDIRYTLRFLLGNFSHLMILLGFWLILRAIEALLRDVKRLLLRSLEGTSGSRATESVLQLRCPNCGSTAPQGTKFCLHCGSLLPQPKICPKCQRVNVPEAKFCGYCGAEIDLR